MSRIVERDAVNGAFHTMEYFTGLGDAQGWRYDVHLSSPLFTSPFSEGTLKYHGENGIGWVRKILAYFGRYYFSF